MRRALLARRMWLLCVVSASFRSKHSLCLHLPLTHKHIVQCVSRPTFWWRPLIEPFLQKTVYNTEAFLTILCIFKWLIILSNTHILLYLHDILSNGNSVVA